VCIFAVCKTRLCPSSFPRSPDSLRPLVTAAGARAGVAAAAAAHAAAVESPLRLFGKPNTVESPPTGGDSTGDPQSPHSPGSDPGPEEGKPVPSGGPDGTCPAHGPSPPPRIPPRPFPRHLHTGPFPLFSRSPRRMRLLSPLTCPLPISGNSLETITNSFDLRLRRTRSNHCNGLHHDFEAMV